MLVSEITTYLATQGVAVRGASMFEAYFPDYVNSGNLTFWDVAVFKPPGGGPPGLEAPLDYPRFQVIVRAEDYNTAASKCQLIFSKLHGLYNTVLSGRRYLLIKAVHDPAHLGLDEENLHRFVCNFECITENPTDWRS